MSAAWRAASAVVASALALLAGCSQLPMDRRETGSKPTLELAPGWTALAPGLLRWQAEPGLHALRLDLQAPGLRLMLSPPSSAGTPIDALPAAQEAIAALNASFFDRSFRVRGLTVSEGQAWPEPMTPQDSPLLACNAAQVCQLQLAAPYSLPEGTHTAVAGTPWLVRQGQARTAEDDARCAAFCANPHPRTAIGLSADRRYLVVLLAEGRRPGVPGISLARTAELLLQLGAHEALNLDGGGSSALLIQGKAAMQRPANEPAQRRVANLLLILRQP